MWSKRYRYDRSDPLAKLEGAALEAKLNFEKKYGSPHQLAKQVCVVCSSGEFMTLATTDRYGFFYPAGMCKNCGFLQQVYYYTEDVLKNFYEGSYRLIYGDISPKGLWDEQFNIKGPLVFELCSRFSRQYTSILEVGCGSGGILGYFKKHNPGTIVGIDYDKAFLDYGCSQGLDLRQGSLETIGESEKFDLIIIRHVLEHLTHPEKFLKSIKQKLSPGGILYIEVPVLEAVAYGKSYGYDLLAFMQNAHFMSFSTKSLDHLMNNSEFERLFGHLGLNWQSLWRSTDFKPLSKAKPLKIYHLCLIGRAETIRVTRTLIKRVLKLLKLDGLFRTLLAK